MRKKSPIIRRFWDNLIEKLIDLKILDMLNIILLMMVILLFIFVLSNA